MGTTCWWAQAIISIFKFGNKAEYGLAPGQRGYGYFSLHWHRWSAALWRCLQMSGRLGLRVTWLPVRGGVPRPPPSATGTAVTVHLRVSDANSPDPASTSADTSTATKTRTQVLVVFLKVAFVRLPPVSACLGMYWHMQ